MASGFSNLKHLKMCVPATVTACHHTCSRGEADEIMPVSKDVRTSPFEFVCFANDCFTARLTQLKLLLKSSSVRGKVTKGPAGVLCILQQCVLEDRCKGTSWGPLYPSAVCLCVLIVSIKTMPGWTTENHPFHRCVSMMYGAVCQHARTLASSPERRTSARNHCSKAGSSSKTAFSSLLWCSS